MRLIWSAVTSSAGLLISPGMRIGVVFQHDDSRRSPGPRDDSGFQASRQLGVFHLGLRDDRDVGVSVFPKGVKIPVGGLRPGQIPGQRERSAQLNVRQCAYGIRAHDATMIENSSRAYGAPGTLVRAFSGLSDSQLVGGSDWINAERFDIVATAGTNATPEQIRAMLRTLLADRFKLAVHTEKRTVSAFVLVMARTDKRLGLRLRSATVDCVNEAAMKRLAADSLRSRYRSSRMGRRETRLRGGVAKPPEMGRLALAEVRRPQRQAC